MKNYKLNFKLRKRNYNVSIVLGSNHNSNPLIVKLVDSINKKGTFNCRLFYGVKNYNNINLCNMSNTIINDVINFKTKTIFNLYNQNLIIFYNCIPSQTLLKKYKINNYKIINNFYFNHIISKSDLFFNKISLGKLFVELFKENKCHLVSREYKEYNEYIAFKYYRNNIIRDNKIMDNFKKQTGHNFNYTNAITNFRKYTSLCLKQHIINSNFNNKQNKKDFNKLNSNSIIDFINDLQMDIIDNIGSNKNVTIMDDYFYLDNINNYSCFHELDYFSLNSNINLCGKYKIDKDNLILRFVSNNDKTIHKTFLELKKYGRPIFLDPYVIDIKVENKNDIFYTIKKNFNYSLNNNFYLSQGD